MSNPRRLRAEFRLFGEVLKERLEPHRRFSEAVRQSADGLIRATRRPVVTARQKGRDDG